MMFGSKEDNNKTNLLLAHEYRGSTSEPNCKKNNKEPFSLRLHCSAKMPLFAYLALLSWLLKCTLHESPGK